MMETTFEHKTRDTSDCQDERSDNIAALTEATTEILNLSFKNMNRAVSVFSELCTALISKSGKKHHCCTCHHMTCGPCMRCKPCGPATSTTDVSLEARLGETRHLSLLIENNRPEAADYALAVHQLINASGQEIQDREVIQFTPATGVIPPGECAKINIKVQLRAPLEAGQVYYAQIKWTAADSSNSLDLGIWVKQSGHVDQLLLSDPCRPRKGKFVEFSQCHCHSHCHCCQNDHRYYLCN